MPTANRLPMFPLGTVLFPLAVLPLHVFEPRYRMMIQACVRGDQEFGVVLIERGSEVGGGDARFNAGTVARIVQVSELEGGRYALTTVGTRLIRVEQWLPDDPYPQAMVVDVEEARLEGDTLTEARAARERVDGALHRLFEIWATIDPRAADIDVTLSDDPMRAAFEACALSPFGPLDAQRLLEAGGTPARLALLESMLAEEIAVLEARGQES
jgi:Lon protease-like protein